MKQTLLGNQPHTPENPDFHVAPTEAVSFDDRSLITPVGAVALGNDIIVPIQSMSRTDKIRIKFAGLDVVKSFQVDDYLSARAPDALKSQVTPDPEADNLPRRWVDWIRTEATDNQLRSVLRWRKQSISDLQKDPNTNERIEKKKAQYAKAVEIGISERWLHPEAAGVPKELETVKIVIGDLFNTSLIDINGCYNSRSDTVVVDEFSMDQSMWHEFNHARLGGFKSWFLNEATTEHINQVFKTGNIEEVDPSLREFRGSYVPLRQLLSKMLQGGGEPIPARLLTRLYSVRSEEARKQCARELAEATQTAYGFDIFNHVEKLMTQGMLYHMNRGVQHTQAGRRTAYAIIDNFNTVLALGEDRQQAA